MAEETTETTETTNTDQGATEVAQNAPERIPDLAGLTVMPSDKGLMEALNALEPEPESPTLEDALKAAESVGTDSAGGGAGVPSDDTTDEPAEPGGASAGESTDNESTQTETVDPAVARDLEKARTALKRVGWDDATLEASSEEFILAQGKRTREAEAEREQQRQRIQELEASEEGGGSKGPDGTTTGAPQVSAVPADAIDPVKLTQPLVDELGEDAAAPLRALAEEVARLQRTVHGQQEESALIRVDEVRQQLGDRFPGLLVDSDFETRVKPEMTKWSNHPDYKGKGTAVLAEVMERAAIMAGLDRADPGVEAAAAEARSQAAASKKAGSSAGPGNKGGSVLSKASNEYLSLEAFKALDRGGEQDPRYLELTAEVQRRRKRSESPY